MIEFNHVTFTYRGTDTPALDDLDLRVGAGECVVLCGKSGCGKSTVLHLVNGMIPNFYDGMLEGSVSVAGIDPFDREMWELADIVGTVFQNPRTQFFTTDTTSEVAFGCENRGLPRADIASRVTAAFKATGIARLRDRSIFGLSGGEKQAVAFAGISAMGPQVLVLDEPSSNLDLGAIELLGRIVSDLKDTGATILIAEHRLGYLEDIADRVVLLEDGRVSRTMSMREVAQMDREERIATGVRPLRPSSPHLGFRTGCRSTDAVHALGEVTGSNVRYAYRDGDRPALDAGRFSVPFGKVTALLGKNGAGKSTFSRCLAGLAKPSGGEFFAHGRRLGEKGRFSLGYVVMQDVNYQLFCPSVAEEVSLSRGRDVEEEYLARIFGQLDLVGMEDRHPMSLSGGQKQRVALAAALASGKQVLILDEPTSGLDFSHMAKVASLVRGIADGGAAVLVVTHDMDLVAECCDSVLLLDGGKVRLESRLTESLLGQVSDFLSKLPEEGSR